MDKTSEAITPKEATPRETQKQTDETRWLIRAVKEINRTENVRGQLVWTERPAEEGPEGRGYREARD